MVRTNRIIWIFDRLAGTRSLELKNAQVNVTRVATGLDGTSHNVRFMYECPEVDPPAPIYFYRGCPASIGVPLCPFRHA